MLTSPAHIVLIAEDGGVPVGMITGSVRRVARYGFPIAEADEGFVTPDARSRGVGRALYTSLERAAREQGCGRVFLASNNNRSDVHE